jgi:hypothetical protein
MTENTPPDPIPPGRDVSAPIEKVVTEITLYGLALLLVPLLPYIMIYGFGRFSSEMRSVGAWGLFLLLTVVFTLAHEAFHVIGWKTWGDLPWSAFTFGVKWEALAPYAHAKQPMRADAYRMGTLLPGVMTGLVPYVMALATGNALMTIVSATMISGAVGDLYVLWMMRGISPSAQVIDHPENVGCIVVDEG